MAPLTSEPLSKDFVFSRVLRAFTFAFAAAVLLVSMTIVLFSYVWDEFLRHPFNAGPYETRIIFVVPTILLVTLIFAKVLWDSAAVKYGQRISAPGTAAWSEPTTHAKHRDRKRFDPAAAESAKPVRTGATGPSGLGAPSGGWDKPKLP